MITVANRIYVSPEYQDEFEERFRNRARLVDGMPGFISNQVLRPVNDGDPYIVFTLWESRKDFENWVESEEFRKGHAQSGNVAQRSVHTIKQARTSRSISRFRSAKFEGGTIGRSLQGSLKQINSRKSDARNRTCSQLPIVSDCPRF